MRKEPINSIEKSERFNYEVFETQNGVWKLFRSPEANYNFNRVTGRMESWGRTEEEDPKEFPAPNILDLEVTTSCKHGCPFCYKSNNPDGVNMSFETFKKIFDVLPKSITQIAFGADYDLTSNLELPTMMYYAKKNGVIPNVTVGYVTDIMADILPEVCGAVAVSRYESKDKCYDSIKKLTDRGMAQVNMHYMIAEETYERALETLEDIKTDPRLTKLNAIVFLSLKQKGRGVSFHPLSQEKFNNLVAYAREIGVGIGFDSCSSLKAYRAFEDRPEVQSSIIPCEAARESSFISVGKTEEGPMYYPCSFAEGEGDWEKGLPVLECNSPEEFIAKIWNHPKTLAFKNRLNKTACDNCENCRHCPIFTV